MQRLALLLLCSLCVASSASAQEQKDQPSEQPRCQDISDLSRECHKQVEEWKKGEQRWRKWNATNGNNRMAAGWGWRLFHPRRPTPPSWVATLCEPLDPNVERKTGDDAQASTTNELCAYYFDVVDYVWWDHYKGFEPPLRMFNKAKNTEYVDFWSWLARSIHYDAAWVPAHTGDNILLVGGAHLDLAQITDRISVFGPGLMMVRVPERNGSHTFRAAETWGFSFRLKDFTFPGTNRDYSLYFNLANCRIHGGPLPDQEVVGTGRSVMGFSMSLKK